MLNETIKYLQSAYDEDGIMDDFKFRKMLNEFEIVRELIYGKGGANFFKCECGSSGSFGGSYFDLAFKVSVRHGRYKDFAKWKTHDLFVLKYEEALVTLYNSWKRSDPMNQSDFTIWLMYFCNEYDRIIAGIAVLVSIQKYKKKKG